MAKLESIYGRLNFLPAIASQPHNDTVKPVLRILAPAQNAVVTGISTPITFDVSDNIAVTEVEFNTGSVFLSDYTAPFEFKWNTTTQGPRTITFTAYDAAGNASLSETRNITVNKDAPSTPTPPGPTPEPVKSGDLTSDGKVNIKDLSVLLSAWGTTNTNADLNKSGKVEIGDLSQLLSAWTG